MYLHVNMKIFSQIIFIFTNYIKRFFYIHSIKDYMRNLDGLLFLIWILILKLKEFSDYIP
jgi:hypothetical protein